jgi:hypothetical protein
MSLQFPTNPALGFTYQSGSSATYRWNGTYWETALPPTQIVLNSTNAANAISASFVATASLATFATSASRAVSSETATSASFSLSASFATSASRAVSASFATTASTTTLAYAAIGISAIPTFQNGDMTPTLQRGEGITVSGNTIIIARPGLYLVNASIGIRATYAEYGWADANNILLAGTNLGMGVSANSIDTACPANAMGIVNITSPNTLIKLRIFVAAGFNVQSGAYAGATITQLR